MANFTLDNAEELHAEFPDSFAIPHREKRENLVAGSLVKLIFRIDLGKQVAVERMWVIVNNRSAQGYVGILDNQPYCTDLVKKGIEIKFQPEHIIQLHHSNSWRNTKQKKPANAGFLTFWHLKTVK